MQNGSLTIGDKLLNYGGGNNWNTNTSGLLLECLDNTEIAIHDHAHRLSSLMYYEGGGTNKITIGRYTGFGTISSVNINGNIIGTGTALTNLNYNAITNKPDLTVYATNTNVSYLLHQAPIRGPSCSPHHEGAGPPLYPEGGGLV